MTRYRRSQDYSEEINVWTSFTDLMSNAFMIMIFLLLLVLLKPLSNESGLETPPIFTIDESGTYRFPSGSAELPEALVAYINQDLVAKIVNHVKDYQVDTIEIIGHTDGQVNGAVVSNLDQNLELVATKRRPLSSLIAGSNADLGLMRAVAVSNQLQLSPSLRNLEFRAYSAAQLVSPQGGLAVISRRSDGSRRRIEIRLRRLKQERVERIR